MSIDYNQIVLGSAEKRQTILKQNSRQSAITIIDAVTADGEYLTPGIVFKGEAQQYQWFKREVLELVPDWHFAHSPNGWTSNEIGAEWVHRILVPQLNPKRTVDNEVDHSQPIVLLLDGLEIHRSVGLFLYFMWLRALIE